MVKKRNATRSDGRIAVQVYIGRDADTGKRRYKTVYGATQKEADSKAREVKVALGKGVDVLADQDSFKSWADMWLSLKESSVSYGMLAAYRSCIQHLLPLWGAPIAKIRTVDLQSIITTLAKKNPNTKKPTAKRTLNCVKITASQIFQMAIDNRVMDYNPAAAVKIPSEAPRETKRALSQEEREWIENTPHRAQLPAMIMLYAGLRRGEVLALTWSDIDLEKRTITVNKAVEMIDGKPVPKQMTKTTSGMRTVYIPQVLANYLAIQSKSTLLVCPSAKGTYMSSTSWKSLWSSYLIELNLKYGKFDNCIGHIPVSKHDPKGIPMVIPHITAHWLRHPYVKGTTKIFFIIIKANQMVCLKIIKYHIINNNKV